MRTCPAVAAVLVLLVVSGCGDGGLEVTPALDGDAALAVGGTTTLRVVRGGSCATIERAEAADSRIARVAEIRGCELDLEGRATGRTSVDIEAAGAARTLDIRTANPHRALIQHTCTEELTATYLVGQRADLRYRLFDGADNPLWGDVFDVELSDPTLVDVQSVEPGAAYARLETADEAGQLDLTPRGRDPAITMKLVSPASLDGLDLEVQSGGEAIEPGESRSSDPVLGLGVVAREGPRHVCNWGRAGFELTVSSSTPDICIIGDKRRGAAALQTKVIETGDEPIRIWIVGRGSCEIQAQLAGQAVGDVSGEVVFNVDF